MVARVWQEILTCPSCGNKMKRQTDYLECVKKQCNKKYPVLLRGGIPILLENPESYVSEYLKEIIQEQEQELEQVKRDHPEQAKVHITRLTRIREELKPFASEFRATPVKYKRYVEKYAKEMNNDEYILSAYGPYIGVKLPIIAYSECLYSTGLNLGAEVSMKKRAKILDIGCGVGRTLLDYSALVIDGIIIGMDLEYSKVRIAYDILKTNSTLRFLYTTNFEYKISEVRGFNRSNIHLMVADAEKLPFAKDSFDLIIVEYLLGLLQEPEKFLKSLHCFLKNNGLLIIADDHGWWERMRPSKRMTSPEMVDRVLQKNFSKEYEFDTPHFEILTDRCYHIHLTRFVRYRKKEIR
jgi:ubiquinone/menaquinone biosynthesis C-methylase UbiE/uncharacterized protein YbaR (Trm112 family)